MLSQYTCQHLHTDKQIRIYRKTGICIWCPAYTEYSKMYTLMQDRGGRQTWTDDQGGVEEEGTMRGGEEGVHGAVGRS